MAEIIVALDLSSRQEALDLAEQLSGLRWVKIGPVLFVREGPDLVRAFIERGYRVFLDLKWHDIPNTVAGAVGAAQELGVAMATVHALGGEDMMRAAAGVATSTALLAATVLTSHDAPGLGAALGRPGLPGVEAEVDRLATQTMNAGLQGLVASAHEVRRLRDRLGPDPVIVVPGIRPTGSPADDQRRAATPGEAVAAGATYLVVGRPITRAAQPGATFEELCRQLDA